MNNRRWVGDDDEDETSALDPSRIVVAGAVFGLDEWDAEVLNQASFVGF